MAEKLAKADVVTLSTEFQDGQKSQLSTQNQRKFSTAPPKTVLLFLICLLLSAIALLEYACHAISGPPPDAKLIEKLLDSPNGLVTKTIYEHNKPVETVVVSYVTTIGSTFVVEGIPDSCTGTCAPNSGYWDEFKTIIPITVSTIINRDGIHTATHKRLVPRIALQTAKSFDSTLKRSASPTSAPTSATNAASLAYSFTGIDYFLGAWLPTLVAVLFAIPWGIIDYRCRSFEPYRQLTRPKGALARDSLCLDYVTGSIIPAQIRALFRGHWAVMLTALLSFCVSVITSLSSEAVKVNVIGSCSSHDRRGCLPYVQVSIPIARVIQVFLGLMTILTMLFWTIAYRRSQSLAADPRSIAGLASLFHEPSIVADFRTIKMPSSPRAIRNRLRNSRYKLDYYSTDKATKLFGLRHSTEPALTSDILSRSSEDYLYSMQCKSAQSQAVPDRYPDPPHVRQSWGRQLCIVVLAAALGSLIAVIIYYKQYSHQYDNTRFESFMDSQTKFGPRFIFTAIGVINRLIWMKFFQEHHSKDVYTCLARGHASANASILTTPSATPLTALFSAFRHRHLLTALLALTAILAEALTITLPNIPFNHATTFAAYTACTYVSVVILAIMVVAAVALLFAGAIPKYVGNDCAPASVLVLLCGSRLGGALRNLGDVGAKQRKRYLQEMGFTYGMGVVRGLDGVARLGIDMDPYVEYAMEKRQGGGSGSREA